jgi:hypothetical protein
MDVPDSADRCVVDDVPDSASTAERTRPTRASPRAHATVMSLGELAERLGV